MSRKAFIHNTTKQRGTPSTFIQGGANDNGQFTNGSLMTFDAHKEPPAGQEWLLMAQAIIPLDKIKDDGVRGQIFPIRCFHTRDEAIDFGKKLIGDGEFNNVTVTMMGRWNTIVTDSKAVSTVMVNGEGQSILNEQKSKEDQEIRASLANHKNRTKQMFENDRLAEDTSTITHYATIMTDLAYLVGLRNERKHLLDEVVEPLEKRLKHKQELDTLYPDYQHKWKDEVNRIANISGKNIFGETSNDIDRRQDILLTALEDMYLQ